MEVKKIKFIAIILAVLMLSGVASATELSDYQYLVAHQDDARNVQVLEDMAYHNGGAEKLEARMAYLETVTPVIVNAYAAYNPATGNLEWTSQ